MNIETVLVLAANLCCEISVNSKGEIELEGDPTNLDKLAPVVRENKTALLYHLTRARRHGLDPGRTWPGNPFTCECGLATGWLRDGKPLCPMCDKTPAPAGAITKEGDCITYAKVFPGRCPLCGGDLSREGLDGCWHMAFHFGNGGATGASPRDNQPTPAPAACENQDGPKNTHEKGSISHELASGCYEAKRKRWIQSKRLCTDH